MLIETLRKNKSIFSRIKCGATSREKRSYNRPFLYFLLVFISLHIYFLPSVFLSIFTLVHMSARS